ncbi:hypothetical protein BO71DRAFT_373226 [Aspergillus ellipticus CBS 707.79]|uniref:AN1-type domain-containing protein n=1 Tax=Aspergillus ellipticus CBS 707.79 TaxID=1448320 RepID=A0A319DJ95_9EURO|nr:hypothetical protein BO71DRAFT_373226 [Aspergillus ellipticus CBS 707.79]
MSPISVTLPNNNNDQRQEDHHHHHHQQQQQSHTTLPDADLDSIGRHCDLPYCNQLDFLPFRCSSCKRTFCLDHRSETAHKCARAGEWARRRQQQEQQSQDTSTSAASTTQKPTIYNSEQCAHLTCKTLIHTLTDPGVRCPECKRSYCLRHRLKEEHECRPSKGAGGGGQGGAGGTETLKSMFAKVRTWGKEKSSSLSSFSGAGGAGAGRGGKPMSRVATVNAMKRTAKGEAGVPVERRVYLAVVGTSETTNLADPPRGEFWFDGRWKVGRLLDDAARRLQVENMNNRGGGEEARLRVFHVESGEFLEFSDVVAEKLKSGDTVVLLRGAGVIL